MRNIEKETWNRGLGTENMGQRTGKEHTEHITGKREGKRICSCLILIGHIFNIKCKQDTVV